MLKSFQTMRAALALKGFELHRLDSGAYVIHKWNLTKHCSDLACVADFLKKVGGQPC